MGANDPRLTTTEAMALAAIVLTGAALRLVAAGAVPLWTDEALTYVIAQAPPLKLATAPVDPTAPLYYWLHQLLVPDGGSVLAGRSISIVAGILTIPVAFALGRALISGAAGLFAAAWTAFAFPLVDYSQEARAYALLVLLILSSALALHRVVTTKNSPRRRALAAFAVITILAIYTHFIALFWVGPALLILRVKSGRTSEQGALRDCWLTCGLIVLAAIPEARRVLRYATEANAFHWLRQPSPPEFARLLSDQWLPFGTTALIVVIALLLVLLAIRSRRFMTAWAQDNRAAVLILAALLVQPLALWLFGFFVSPVVMARTMLPSLPAVGLLIALIIDPLRPRPRLFAGLIIAAVVLTATLVGGTVRSKEGWAGVRSILKEAEPEALIVVCPHWKGPALMAATREIGAGPLAMWVTGRMKLVEQRLGKERRWDRLYFDRVFIQSKPSNEQIVQLRPGEIWLVASECSPAELAAIASWMGPMGVQQRWHLPADGGHAAITVARSEGGPLRERTLVIAR
ncbi:MAG: glycosyltransferase family 39 protein [Pseudomonadota bacterium]|nr:glycosyltransferase family 39 protein [Pseudomonadota bacterium]